MLEVRFGSEIISRKSMATGSTPPALRRNRRRVRAAIFPNNGAGAVILTDGMQRNSNLNGWVSREKRGLGPGEWQIQHL
jgi:hypothetical protein